ncbi:putative bifunctional diguanylate cyclase/phosphodiesterase [Actinoplanes sp. NPDC049265]|uniref:putative bifunctional diguanylate cyclase/phosphodiesterase n=1 Tax=Actinoplanes sp. NPDC049265 TaxID=3363902 RepID=UPI0037230C20
MRARVAQWCFAAWMVLLTAVYYAWPEGHVFTWSSIAASSAAAIVAGICWHRPRRWIAWALVAGSVACFAAGDTIYYVQQLSGTPPFPGPADLLYLVVYVLLAAGLLIFVRAQAGAGSNRAALLDALVPTVGLGLLSWVYLIAPYTRADNLSLIEKVVSVGYPLGDVLALAILLRLLVAPGRNPRSLTLLSLSVIGLFGSDVVYGLARLDTAWDTGGPTEIGWVLYYLFLGLAGLNPSMTTLGTRREVAGDVEAGGRRLAFMTVAALVAPAVLYIEYLQDKLADAPVISGAAALMFLLVLSRVGGLITAQRQAAARERALREASATLFSAATFDDVRGALRAAIDKLMPSGRPYELVITEREAGESPAEAVFGLVPAAEVPPDVPTDGYQTVLYGVVPLPGTPPRLGVAALGAPVAVLRMVQPSFETLFQQMSVVLERIRLTREVHQRDSEAYFRTLIQSASDVILIVGDDQTITYASPSAATTFGHTELTGRPLSTIVADTHATELADLLAQVRVGGGATIDGADLTAVCADRRLLQVECDARDLRDDRTVGGVVLTLRDVTERRRLENDLAHQAFHDGLTGLANRVLFRNRLEHAFALAERDGSAIGVLFVDLDDFKEVNDTLGHAVGDQLLVAAAKRIASTIGAGNTAARMGGDEFAILIEHNDDPGAAEDVAARIVSALSVPVDLSDGLGGLYVVSAAASVGVAVSRDASSATELLRHADMALYLAKGAGKATWQPYRSDLHSAMKERLEMRTALHEAVDAEQFVVQYQPIVDLSGRTLAGVEALVRWQHPVRGLLGPQHFIELAEENGAITGIGAWVMRESLRQLVEWSPAGGDAPGYVSVNVSARQFRSAGFVGQVREALTETGAKPRQLLLEITESLVLRDAEQVWEDLRELRALGVRIAIDDFGTGYSSLSYLRQMPVDVLKIDKSFIDDILGSAQQRALVNAIVTLARNLDLAVVAEGIEDAEQHALLERMGCPYGQGYLFARPVWPDVVTGWISSSPAIFGG